MTERVAVVGAGTMGHGIAQVAAAAGCEVVLIDTTPELVSSGLARIGDNLKEAIRRGKQSRHERDAILARLSIATDLAGAVADRHIVIEAVPERLDLKIAVFTALESATPPACMLASNTSSLSIDEIQGSLKHPDRMVGLHFFNPVYINPLVEIVRGMATSEVTLGRAIEFVRLLGKESILVKDSPGFATSRLGVLLALEAMRMLEEGVASAEDIDRALELGYRHPMGPLKLTDLVGLDVRLDIARYLHGRLGGEHFRPPRILERMVEQGRLGKKTGEGFYRW